MSTAKDTPRSRLRSSAALVRSRKSIAQPNRPPFILRATIGSILRALRREAAAWNAPILTLMAAERGDPFLTLIGCILSLRTKDETTAIAAPRLFERASTPAAMLASDVAEIARLIYPVAYAQGGRPQDRQPGRDRGLR
jgi:hypothetical protein